MSSKEFMLKAFTSSWRKHSGDRKKIMAEMGICYRTTVNYKKILLDRGVKLFIAHTKARKLTFSEACPTPAQRRKYKDEMLNRDFL